MLERKVKKLSKVCPKCSHSNESDSNFCRSCGTDLTTPAIPGKSDKQAEFVGYSRPRQDDFLCFGEPSETGGGVIVGAVFIILGLFIGFVLLFPNFIGDFFGGFGESMGNLGSDFGTFMGDWGSTFGNSIGNFFDQIFTDTQWWTVVQLLIPIIFIVLGLIVILRSR